jgi:hypothetical protein
MEFSLVFYIKFLRKIYLTVYLVAAQLALLQRTLKGIIFIQNIHTPVAFKDRRLGSKGHGLPVLNSACPKLHSLPVLSASCMNNCSVTLHTEEGISKMRRLSSVRSLQNILFCKCKKCGRGEATRGKARAPPPKKKIHH